MDKTKKLLTILVSVLIVVIILLVMIFSNRTTNKPITNNTITNTEEIEDSNNYEEPMGNEEQTIEVEEPKDIVFSETEQQKVNDTFTTLLKNEVYQTQVQEGDILVDITFKDIGTVTFKMYQKTAPTSVNWFLNLIENNVEIKTKESDSDAYSKFYFVTTEREYNYDEATTDIFPMKYTLYHRLYSCHTFFFCTNDYVENIIDTNNVDVKYIDYLKKYGGNFAEFGNCVVLGRAVENAILLDQLKNGYEIEKITIRK